MVVQFTGRKLAKVSKIFSILCVVYGVMCFIHCDWFNTFVFMFDLVAAVFGTIKKEMTEDQLFVRHIRQQEYMVDRCKQTSVKHNKPIERQVIVMDMKNVSMQLDFMALRTFKRTLTVDESCYPERLEALLMINAPYTFSVLWAIIKPWIDPITVSKFKILGTNYQKEMKELIAEDQIPVEYGGTRENFSWTFPGNRE